MKLIFEKSRPGRGGCLLPTSDVPDYQLEAFWRRQEPLRLPEISEGDLARHYTALAKQTYGVNDGFYPLGSCTMKYNPRINEEIAALQDFTGIHPLQPLSMAQGCLEVLYLAEKYLCEITAMDHMTFQPAAGAQGEFTGMLLIKAYHQAKGQLQRNKIIVPDGAHGTNPASGAMAGFQIINLPSNKEGMVDLAALKAVVGEDTAGLMLTNPNTLGLFDKNILAITELVHQAGGLNYYDGANLNAVMGKARPGDMGFDLVHLNLHKTFATPHGGGGPGAGPVGCKEILAPYLPGCGVQEVAAWSEAAEAEMDLIKEAAAQQVAATESEGQRQNPRGPQDESQNGDQEVHQAALDLLAKLQKQAGPELELAEGGSKSIGRVKGFYGNFLVVVRALTYILTLGRQGIPQAAENAVLNANYLMHGLEDLYPVAYGKHCMHEFVISLEALKKKTGVSAMDIAKGLLDRGIHPPTMYFPLIVHEALMLEPTETESQETLEEVVEIFRDLYQMAQQDPARLQASPLTTAVGRLDEVGAARHPRLRYEFPQ